MQGAATFLGHPLHPILVPFPIAFFIGSLACDLIFIFRRTDFWKRAALVLIGFGILGGLAAAAFGLIDYLTLSLGGEPLEDATAHMIANLVIVALFGVNFFLRRKNPESKLGLALSLLGVLGLLYSGWLGGEMVYKDGLGVSPEASELLGRY